MTYDIRRLSRNNQGRDFIVGDIHGTFSLVFEAMRSVDFDEKKDRLIAVGDLIDRGSESHRCVDFLALPYVYSIRGNHEDMLLDLYKNGEPHSAILEYVTTHNGFGWWNDTSACLRKEIIDAISLLPLVIEIETELGLMGVVHADIPDLMSWPQFISGIESKNNKIKETCLWSRNRAARSSPVDVDGIVRVYVGHTPSLNGIHQMGNVFNLDTGCVFSQNDSNQNACLSFVQIDCSQSKLVSPLHIQNKMNIKLK